LSRRPRSHAALEAQLTATKKSSFVVESVSIVTNAFVGDLTKLSALGGARTYYVRIAADTSRERWEYSPENRNQFAGAQSSGLVAIRDPRPPSGNFELVFGQHVSLVAAEVFQRLAMSHHFPPPGQVAQIVPRRCRI